MNRPRSRRHLLRSAAGAALATTLTTRRSVDAKDAPKRGANERIGLGVIGCGNRGPYDGYLIHLVPGVEWRSICDVHEDRLDKAEEFFQGVTKRKPRVHRDYRDLLEEKNIDVVAIATSIHWHALPAIHACETGKDVYLEKPVATSIGEGRAVVDAARRHDRIVQMGTQQHSWEHYRKAVEIIRSGELGEISKVHVWDVWNQYPGFGSPPDAAPPPALDWNFYLGPAPKVRYNPNRFLHHDWFFDYGGGWQLAWGVHHYDIVHWAMDVVAPVTAVGSGGRYAFADNREWPDTFQGMCEYPPGPVARKGFLMEYTCRTGCDQRIMGCHHGKAFFGANGVLVIDRNGFTLHAQTRYGQKLVDEKTMPTVKSEHEVVKDHTRSFIDCVRSRERPEADVEVGHRSTNPGHLMNIAFKLGRRVAWDADRERFRDDPEADALITKTYREPWMLPPAGTS